MALQLKTEDSEKNKNMTNDNLDASLDDGFTEESTGINPGVKPVVISTYVPPVSNVKKDSTGTKIVKIVIGIIVCLVLFFVGKNLINRFNPKSEDITELVNQTESVIASTLSLDFQDAPGKVPSVHQYSGGNVSVHSAGDLSVIYINNRQVGVKVDSKKYSMFGVKIGDGEVTADREMTYDAYDSFSVLEDMMDGGDSVSYFYYNPEKNDCFLLIINSNTNRVVSMTYYNDFRLISRNLSGIDD